MEGLGQCGKPSQVSLFPGVLGKGVLWGMINVPAEDGWSLPHVGHQVAGPSVTLQLQDAGPSLHALFSPLDLLFLSTCPLADKRKKARIKKGARQAGQTQK